MKGAADSTVLAFDYGKRRTGVAVGDLGFGQAHPLTTLESKAQTLDQTVAAIAPLIDTWRPVALVLGLPLDEQGKDRPLTKSCRKLANKLQDRFSIPVHLVDERYSSSEASLMLRDVRRLDATRSRRSDATRSKRSEATRSKRSEATRSKRSAKHTVKNHTDTVAACVLLQTWLSSDAA